MTEFKSYNFKIPFLVIVKTYRKHCFTVENGIIRIKIQFIIESITIWKVFHEIENL
jgi:hypothetical protein